MSHDLCVGECQHLGDAAIDGSQGAIERAGKGYVIERVDQLLETPLGALNHLAELIELLIGRSNAGTVVQIVEQVLEFRDLTATAEGICGEQDRQHQKSYGDCTKMIRKALQAFPGKRSQAGSEKDEKCEGKPPQPGFFFF